MKLISLLSFTFTFLLVNNLSYGQERIPTEWELIESSPLPNGNAEAWAIGTDQNGNIIWGVNKDMPGLFEFVNGLVYKLDDDSNTIWVDTAATGIYAQQSYNLNVADDLVYLGGRTCSTIGIDNCDLLLFTTDVNTGETGWEFTWDQGFGYEEIDGISIEPDGIILTGWTKGNGSEMDVLLLKIDFNGEIIWQTSLSSPNAKDDHQDGHIVVDDSHIFISGLYDGSPLLGWDGRALLAKFDKTDGSLIDTVLYGRQDQWLNAENALGMATDGTYLYTTGYTTNSPNNWDIFVAKFDKDLNRIWYTTWGGDQTESARAISVHEDGSIYIGGNTQSFGNGGFEMSLLKLNSLGTVEWYKTWGGELDDQILDIHLNDNNLYLTGKTQSFHPTNKWEAVLLNVDLSNITTSTEFVTSPDPELVIAPNPTFNNATLRLANPVMKMKELSIFNAMGKRVVQMSNMTANEITIEKNALGSGIFFFHVQLANQKKLNGKLIIN